MTSLLRSRALCVRVGLLRLLALACAEDPVGRAADSPCPVSAPPVFLASALDDDDGDGNPYDEDFPRINDEDDDIADHTWVRDMSGTFHLFFQNEDHG